MFIPDDKPLRAEVPAPLATAELMKDFKPRATVAAGEVFEPSQANIDQRTRIVKMGELQVALLPKKTRGETVNVSMAFRFGDEKSLHGQALVQQLTAEMLNRGTGRLTRQQIADRFDRASFVADLEERHAAWVRSARRCNCST